MSDPVTIIDASDTIVNVAVSNPDVVVVTDNTRTGPQGSQGVQGSTGPAGPAGGPQGFQGVQGAAGTTTAFIFDGGGPLNNYSNGPAFDCGGVA